MSLSLAGCGRGLGTGLFPGWLRIAGAYSIISRWLSCYLAGEVEFWSEFGKFSEVLGGGGKEELVAGAAWATQA